MDETKLNDLLECSVCFERLDTSAKVLPCQHTFCRKCLEEIVASKKELRCPECRVVITIPIDELPPNVLLMRILEVMKSSPSSNKDQPRTQENPNPNPKAEEKPSSGPSNKKVYPPNIKNETAAAGPIHQQQQQENNRHSLGNIPQQKRQVLAHAYAKFDFKTQEPNKLQFSKGDLILLKRIIDKDWCVGQCYGKEGAFPIAYVNVVVPLPVPQCVALYDFKMGPNEDEGCLSFKKGTAIHVLRRVDQHWAEGRIGANVGIFPIAFVELNPMAKQVLQIANKPPTTAVENQTQKPETSRNLQQMPLTNPANLKRQQQQAMIASYNEHFSRNENGGGMINRNGSKATQPSTNASMNPSRSVDSLYTRANSPSQSSSPNQEKTGKSSQNKKPYETNSVRFRESKRHSLHSLISSPNLSLVQSNRHSVEILSLPTDFEQQNAAASTSNPSPQARPLVSSNLMVKQQTPGPKLPWVYIALYPYKPRKNDELELEKGRYYLVIERCMDGWFKGKNKQEISGVFPGNYVAPLRAADQQVFFFENRSFSSNPPPPSSNLIQPSSAVQTTNNSSNNLEISNFRRDGFLPDLPPRSFVNDTPSNPSSVWCSPLVHPIDALLNRHKNPNVPQRVSSPPSVQEQKDSDNKMKESSSSSSSGALNLMKRLSNMKAHCKTKINNNNNNNQMHSDQIDFNENLNQRDKQTPLKCINGNDSKANRPIGLNAIHVRSGSCPSQLLQTNPNPPSNLNENIYALHQQQPQPQQSQMPLACGSQRMKNKERPHLIVGRKSLDAAALSNIYNNSLKQEPTSTITSSQANQQMYWNPNHNSELIAHRKSSSFDASNILNTGINNHISESAIKASATSKSLHGTSERFRCIIPYPSNCDVELDLNVGDVLFVQRKQSNGWYKGTNAKTNKTGLFPGSFVVPDFCPPQQ